MRIKWVQFFLSAHCQGTTQTSGHEVGGPRGAWPLPNQTVGFPGRPARAVNTPISSVGNFFYSETTVIGSSLQSSSMVQCNMFCMYSMLENVRDGWSMWYLFLEVLERIEDKYVNFFEISDGHPNMWATSLLTQFHHQIEVSNACNWS